jgi:fucose permease
MLAFQFQTVASAAPFLIGSFAIDYTQFSVLIGPSMPPGIFTALPDGMLDRRSGVKQLVLAGLLLMAAGEALMDARFLPVAIGQSAGWRYPAGARRHGA